MAHLQTSRVVSVAVCTTFAFALAAQAPAPKALKRVFDHGGDAWLRVTLSSRSHQSTTRVGR